MSRPFRRRDPKTHTKAPRPPKRPCCECPRLAADYYTVSPTSNRETNLAWCRDCYERAYARHLRDLTAERSRWL